MGTNHRRLGRIEQKARGIEHAKPKRDAKRVVGIWNARRAGGRGDYEAALFNSAALS
jgi:hypothetical protein